MSEEENLKKALAEAERVSKILKVSLERALLLMMVHQLGCIHYHMDLEYEILYGARSKSMQKRS